MLADEREGALEHHVLYHLNESILEDHVLKRPLRHFAFTCIVLCAVGTGDTVLASRVEKISQPELKGLDTGEPSGVITLGQALSLAIMKNPGLAAYSWEVRAAEARILQASLLPNPEFNFEAEELGWSDARNGIGSAVMYFIFSQMLELGDKRGKRTSVAELETDIEDWEYASKRLDLFAETTKAFIRALAARKRIASSEKFHYLANRVFQVVSERVEAGKVSPLEKTKAQVTVAGTRIELERARRQWDVTRKRFWAWLFPLLNLIPVFRTRETPELMHKNKFMFSHCFNHLADSGSILIFPEGFSVTERRMRKLKAGAARIALGVEDENNRRTL